MKKLFFVLTVAMLTLSVCAAKIHDYETDLESAWTPSGSGSTVGIVTDSDSAEASTERANDRLDSAIGTAGTQSAKYAWTWDSTALEHAVRLFNRTDLIDAGGLGFYYYYNGPTDLKLSMTILEAPASTEEEPNNNETYEATAPITITAQAYWQYVYYDFSTTDWTTDSWVIALGLGDGTLDIGDADDAYRYDSLYITPAETPTADDSITLYLDDIYDGAEQTPEAVPSSASTWSLFK